MQAILEDINRFHIEDIKNPHHPATYIKQPNYSLLILRLPTMGEKGVVAVSYAFVVTPEKFFYFDRHKGNFEKFASMEAFHAFVDDRTDETMELVNKFHSEIEDMEERLYSSKIKSKRFNENWLRYKKNLITCHRVLQRSNDAIGAFLGSFLVEDASFQNSFDDVAEHIHRSLRSVGHATEKLDAIYNYQKTIMNERMNQTIYLLTIVSGIFLPLNLIVGFFGMNTSDLPFSSGIDGTLKAGGVLFCAFFIASFLLYFFKQNR